jgi:Tfp pilus assembly protein PilF
MQDKALDLATKALASDPTLADAFVVRGWALHEQKNDVGARDAADAARRLAPTSPRALLLAAELVGTAGDQAAAEKLLRDALSRPIDRHLAAVAFEALAEVYGRIGEVDADEQARRKEIELEPESAWAKGNFASFLIYKGDYDAAIAEAQAALTQMRYGNAEATLAHAYCAKGQELLWDDGDAERAAQAFQTAGASDVCASYGTGAYHQYVGVTRHDAAQLAEAGRWYQRALSLDPENALARTALAALGK